MKKIILLLLSSAGVVWAQQEKVTLCHVPPGNPENAVTIETANPSARISTPRPARGLRDMSWTPRDAVRTALLTRLTRPTRLSRRQTEAQDNRSKCLATRR